MSKKSTQILCVNVLEEVDVRDITQSPLSLQELFILSIILKPLQDFASLSTSNEHSLK